MTDQTTLGEPTDPEATTWALSGFADEIDPNPAIQVAVLQALGARHLEVRSAWDVNIVDLPAARLDELATLFAAQGMAVSAIASPVGKVDVGLPVAHERDRLDRALRAAEVLGARYVRIFSFFYEGRRPEEVRDAVIERLRVLAERAGEHGVVLLHENEKKIYGDVPQRIVDLIETVDSPALRVAFDPANFVQCGVRPFTDAYPLLRPYLEYLQIKDAVFTDGTVRPAGHGDGELAETLDALRASGYTGFASLEPHLTGAHGLGGFSGPAAFGVAARAFADLAAHAGIRLG